MNYYESLQNYFDNGCVLHPGTPPVWGEAGYKKYMDEKITNLGIKPGDLISVEEKWHHGKVNSYQGIVLQLTDDRIYLLTKGKRVWKDRSNREDVVIEYITKIDKLEEASPEFDLQYADPFYKPAGEEKREAEQLDIELEEKRTKRFQRQMLAAFPNDNFAEKAILWMGFNFYWNYDNGTVKAANINIIKKNGDSCELPDYHLRHVYPNHSYFTACGPKYYNEQEEGIALFLNSVEDLEQIKFISCLWTVDADGEERYFLSIIYPVFEKGCDNVYSIKCTSTDMHTYEKSLHSFSVFSERMEEDFTKAFLYVSDAEGEGIMSIMNAQDAVETNLLDVMLCLNNNNLEKLIGNMQNTKMRTAEVLVREAHVSPKGYIWPY